MIGFINLGNLIRFDINLKLTGYNEVMITYVLGAASPDFAISKEVYETGWASNGAIKNTATKYGLPLVLRHSGGSNFGAPLFFSQYSFLDHKEAKKKKRRRKHQSQHLKPVHIR